MALARYKLSSIASGKLDGQTAYFAYCTPPDNPDWGACFIVFVRDQRLHVLKIAYQLERRKDVVQEIAGSFQFLGRSTGPAKPSPKISEVPAKKVQKSP